MTIRLLSLVLVCTICTLNCFFRLRRFIIYTAYLHSIHIPLTLPRASTLRTLNLYHTVPHLTPDDRYYNSTNRTTLTLICLILMSSEITRAHTCTECALRLLVCVYACLCACEGSNLGELSKVDISGY